MPGVAPLAALVFPVYTSKCNPKISKLYLVGNSLHANLTFSRCNCNRL